MCHVILMLEILKITHMLGILEVSHDCNSHALNFGVLNTRGNIFDILILIFKFDF